MTGQKVKGSIRCRGQSLAAAREDGSNAPPNSLTALVRFSAFPAISAFPGDPGVSQISSFVSEPFTVRQILRMFEFCSSTGSNPCGSP